MSLSESTSHADAGHILGQASGQNKIWFGWKLSARTNNWFYTLMTIFTQRLPSKILERPPRMSPAWIQWHSQSKKLGGQIFDFKRITLFCLEKRLSKHKMTIFSKNFLGGMSPLAPPGCAYAWIWSPFGVKPECYTLTNPSSSACIATEPSNFAHIPNHSISAKNLFWDFIYFMKKLHWTVCCQTLFFASGK